MKCRGDFGHWKDLPEHVRAKWMHKVMAVLEAIEKGKDHDRG